MIRADQAAFEVLDLADQLEADGQPDLAERWRMLVRWWEHRTDRPE